MPNLVRWDRGIAVAPYVRGLKQERAVVIALSDSQRARIFLYRDGNVQEMDDLRADTFMGDLSDSGVSKRSQTRTGTRGETSTDAGQRYLEVAAERMVKELVEVIEHHAGDHGFVVIGGTVEMQNRVRDALSKEFDDRVAIDPALHVDMRDAELRRAVGGTASELTKRWQMNLVEFLFDQARAGGRATIGYRDTEQALEQMRVDTLLLSRARTREHAEDADRLIGMAFAGGAHVEEVAGAAGDLLDKEAEGIASRLRFRLMEPQTGHPDEIETPEAQGERARREASRSQMRQAAGD
jgi:stalled ribosome rescue protein Dom34